jgi:hypothetical protein
LADELLAPLKDGKLSALRLARELIAAYGVEEILLLLETKFEDLVDAAAFAKGLDNAAPCKAPLVANGRVARSLDVAALSRVCDGPPKEGKFSSFSSV